MSQVSRPPRDLPPPPGEIPSDLALPGARSLGISPPPFSVFEVLISYILLGSKTTAERSAISIHAPIIRDVVKETHLEVVDCACVVRLSVIFIFCEFRRIANKNFLKKSLVLSLSLNYFCLKQTSWKFGNTDN